MKDNKVHMPSSMGGLMRYFDDYKSKLELKPGHIVLLAIIVVIIEIVLHTVA